MPFPPPGDRANPGLKPVCPESPALTGRFFTTVSPGKPPPSRLTAALTAIAAEFCTNMPPGLLHPCLHIHRHSQGGTYVELLEAATQHTNTQSTKEHNLLKAQTVQGEQQTHGVSSKLAQLSKTVILRNSLEGQCLGLHAFTAKGKGSIPGWGTKTCISANESSAFQTMSCDPFVSQNQCNSLQIFILKNEVEHSKAENSSIILYWRSQDCFCETSVSMYVGYISAMKSVFLGTPWQSNSRLATLSFHCSRHRFNPW